MTPKMEDTVVNTEYGSVRGTYERSVLGFSYCAFKGIPYAKPPIGELRFQDPEPCEKWEGVKDAKAYGNVSLQYDTYTNACIGNEDCLYINVFVKSMRNVDNKKPVMFFIHGGEYIYGSGDDKYCGPDYLTRKNIVLVTFNYRLGIFGFLNLNDPISSGNQGIKDQIMALQWVRNNIANFGGDPNNITIFGGSVGAVSAHLLTQLPQVKGLFHKVILQSGSAFNHWACVKQIRTFTFQLCTYMGIYSQDPIRIYNFFKLVDSERLIEAQEQSPWHTITIFGPAVDSKSQNSILPVAAEKLASEGIHLPCLIGFNNREGMSIIKDAYTALNKNLNLLIPVHAKELFKKKYDLTPDDIKYIYFKDEKISQDNIQNLIDLSKDINMEDGVHEAIKVQVEKSNTPTYVYKFSYDKELSMFKSTLDTIIPGAGHFDEMEYLFYMSIRKTMGLKDLKQNSHAYKLMEQMTDLWTNFATYGDPTPTTSELLPVKWEPVKSNKTINYLNIDTELQMETMPYKEQFYLSVKNEEREI